LSHRREDTDMKKHRLARSLLLADLFRLGEEVALAGVAVAAWRAA
jgi:hypothetical protein